MSERMRVHILAKVLNVPSKTIIEKCKAEGIDTVKNHMSTLSAGLHATILEWFSEGTHDTTVETAERINLEEIRLPSRQLVAVHAGAASGGQSDTAVVDEIAVNSVETVVQPTEVVEPSLPAAATVAEEKPPTAATPSDTDVETLTAAEVSATTQPTEDVAEPPTKAEPDARVEKSAETEPPSADEEEATATAEPVAPAGPQNVPQAAKLQGPRVVRYEAPDRDIPPPRRARSREAGYESPYAPGPSAPGTPGDRGGADKAARDKAKGAAVRKGGRLSEAGEKIHEWRNRDLEERRERLAGATGRRIHRRRSVQSTGGQARRDVGPRTAATVHEPVRIKELCAQAGLNFMQLFRVLKEEHSLLANINMTIPVDTAQLVALHFGIELTVVPRRTALDALQEEVDQRERANLTARPPVVTILGHVDHGKTSLLDSIRKSHVVSGEDGGITQHISSYHLVTADGAVTFLDTPGHEAFTAMRARGAQLTDVVVLVVAADDGVMPQTVEAIRHAQAAKVPVVIALNKIDLGDQNKVKIFGELAGHELAPTEWGGEVDVIETSAKTGQGIKELADHLAALSSVLELKADATLPAVGTAIEAETKPGVGPVVQLLVQEGTLRVGDFVVCGNACGKIRALLNDRGARIEEAGPAIPVEVWGLDDVPSSGDKLFAVENMQRAKQIAAEVKQQRIESARVQVRKAISLEDIFKQRDSSEVPELNVIIKADVDGSIAALKQALGEISSDEVRLAIRHAAVGPVNDSDVLLAETCDGIAIAFRVDVPAGTKRLADEHGVEVRPYRVIYEVCDDVRKALSGLLAPEERVEERGAVEVRQVFRVSKVGVVAGSYVTDGTVDRKHLARLVRDGTIIREGCELASLRHFKDDVRTVRAGLECGIRLEGFDDVHVGDRIEMYEIVKIARFL